MNNIAKAIIARRLKYISSYTKALGFTARSLPVDKNVTVLARNTMPVAIEIPANPILLCKAILLLLTSQDCTTNKIIQAK